MVDAGGPRGQVVLGKVENLGQAPRGAFDAVAQAHDLQIGALGQRAADGAHGIGVVEEPGVGAQVVHVLGNRLEHRHGAQSARPPARANRVAGGEDHAVLFGNVEVDGPQAPVVQRNGDDDVVRAVQQVAPVGGRFDPVGHVPLGDHALDDARGDVQRVRVEVAEGDGAAGQVVAGVPEVGHDGGGEDAAGPDDDDLDGCHGGADLARGRSRQGDASHCTSRPPSTTRVAAVIQLARSLARNTAAPATSGGSPKSGIGAPFQRTGAWPAGASLPVMLV